MNGAAEHGNGFAKYRLAKCYLEGKGRAVDAESAARLFAEAAQASDVSVRRFVTPWAKYQLGKLYIRGNGVPKDWAKAEELLRSAAQDGNEFAQRLLQRRAQWHRLGPMDAALGVIGSLCRMFETSAPHIRPRCMYLDRKRRRELEQKQRALGMRKTILNRRCDAGKKEKQPARGQVGYLAGTWHVSL